MCLYITCRTFDIQFCSNHLHRMMTSSRGVSIFCVLAPLVVSCESVFQDLSSINDLKKLDFGQTVPTHSLLLLHWFANVIDIDQFNTITLTFDPDKEDFGSHHYGNYEYMLDPPPERSRYFTVGNLYEVTSHELPGYVFHPPVREYEGNNMDRIIFRVQETNPRVHRIDQVYLTQHFRSDEHQGTRYNPERTYRISPNLLQQMRMFSVQNNHRSLWELRDLFNSHAEDTQVRDIRNIWGEGLATVGLLLFIVIQKKCLIIIRKPHKQSDSNKPEAEEAGDTPTQANYKTSGCNGPNLLVENYRQQLESIDQDELCQPEQDGTRVPRVRTNYNDSLSSLTENHKDASTDDFDPSIHSLSSALSEVGSWRQQSEQRVSDFPIHRHLLQLFWGDPEVFPGQLRDVVPPVYPTSSPEPLPSGTCLECLPRETTRRHLEQIPEPPQLAPLDPLNNYSHGREQNDIDVKKLTGCLLLLLVLVVSHCLSDIVQFEYAGRGYERPGRVAIAGYNAHLELVAKKHKACARLYVKEHFRKWKYEFEQSWVGFYKSADKETTQYEWGQWQWVTRLEPCWGTVDYNGYCFEYCSDMEAAPGVQARFILSQYREIAHTPSLHSPSGVKITGYNVHLELFETNYKMCARLYVKKSFTQWTSDLASSWVGFYTSPQRGTQEYEQWQWAIKFQQYDSYWEFDVFEYCSAMKAIPGVHARFIISNTEKARTRNWHLL